MNVNILLEKLPAPLRRHPALSGAAGLALLVLAFLLLRPSRPAGEATAYHEVRRGDFTVSVVEGGTLSAVSEIIIRSEVEGTARIISIVPEGSYVKKGDLLIELDSASAQDQVNLQQINYEKAKFAVEQALAQLEIQKSATNSEYLAAQLKLKLARIDLEEVPNRASGSWIWSRPATSSCKPKPSWWSTRTRTGIPPTWRPKGTRPNRRWMETA